MSNDDSKQGELIRNSTLSGQLPGELIRNSTLSGQLPGQVPQNVQQSMNNNIHLSINDSSIKCPINYTGYNFGTPIEPVRLCMAAPISKTTTTWSDDKNKGQTLWGQTFYPVQTSTSNYNGCPEAEVNKNGVTQVVTAADITLPGTTTTSTWINNSSRPQSIVSQAVSMFGGGQQVIQPSSQPITNSSGNAGAFASICLTKPLN
jgi:hypothetical protein